MTASLLLVSEAAARLQVSEWTVRDWARRELLPAGVVVRLPGGGIRFDGQRLEEWIAAGGAIAKPASNVAPIRGARAR